MPFGQCHGHCEFVSQAVDTQAIRLQGCFLAIAQLLVDAKTHSVEYEELAHC